MLGPCLLCGAECCRNHLITITAFDMLRLAEDGYRPSDFAVLAPLKILNYDNEMVLEAHDSGCAEDYLLAIKSHPCYFLEGRGCSVHKLAPSVCKAYPKNAQGKMIGRLCPGVPKAMHSLLGTQIRKEYEKEIDAYRLIVKEWNKGRGKKAACMPFLLEKAKERADEVWK